MDLRHAQFPSKSAAEATASPLERERLSGFEVDSAAAPLEAQRSATALAHESLASGALNAAAWPARMRGAVLRSRLAAFVFPLSGSINGRLATCISVFGRSRACRRPIGQIEGPPSPAATRLGEVGQYPRRRSLLVIACCPFVTQQPADSRGRAAASARRRPSFLPCNRFPSFAHPFSGRKVWRPSRRLTPCHAFTSTRTRTLIERSSSHVENACTAERTGHGKPAYPHCRQR